MPELQVIARHTTVEGMRDAVLAILPKLIEASRKEPGNLAFDAYLNVDDPRSYVCWSGMPRVPRSPRTVKRRIFKELMLGQILPKLESRVIGQHGVATDGDEVRLS